MEEIIKNKDGRGGKREGAGRKASKIPLVNTGVRLDPDLSEFVNKLAVHSSRTDIVNQCIRYVMNSGMADKILNDEE
jgi:hypothetical protein